MFLDICVLVLLAAASQCVRREEARTSTSMPSSLCLFMAIQPLMLLQVFKLYYTNLVLLLIGIYDNIIL